MIFSNNSYSGGGTTKEIIAKNFTWLFLGNTGSRFLKALIVLYAARILGTEGYGIFSYALGLGGLFVFFKNIGIDGLLTREVAKKKENESRYFSTSLWIEFGLLVITALAILFIAPFLSTARAATLLLPLVTIIIVFDDLRDFFIAYFRGKERMELEALAVGVANVAIVALGLMALYFFGTPFAFMVAYAVASFLGVIVILRFLRPVIFNIARDFSKEKVLPILSAAWPLAFAGFASVFLFNIDIVMLGWWKTTGDIGLYSVAQRLVGILAFFSGLVATATFPALARFARSETKEQLKKLFEGTVRIILLISIPFVLGGLIVGKSLLGFIFGQDFVPSFTAFAILLFSVLVIHPMPIFSNLFFAFNKQIKLVPYAFIAAFLNI
ncbi:MAG: flippase, partial [Candidatus Pacebacteria bacterium]|nr:flippase [Candidatus Paceibacterota bacterium]